jgi:membrane-associated protein
MQIITSLIDIFLHLDVHLATVIHTYQAWTYLLLFFVIFMETGFVITPFLPGDSLIFAASAIAASVAIDGGSSPLNIYVLFFVFALAAIAGDTVNYWIGHTVGPRAFSGNIRFLKKEYLDRTHAFFEKHGGKTIILARFIPIIRTFAPFVAGVGEMTYLHFISYNVIGGLAWVGLFTFVGYFFGNLSIVKHNFSLVIIAIILLSISPAIIEWLRSRGRSRATVVVERIDE